VICVIIFFLSLQSICLSINKVNVMRFLNLMERFQETCYKCSSCECAELDWFSMSKIKVTATPSVVKNPLMGLFHPHKPLSDNSLN